MTPRDVLNLWSAIFATPRFGVCGSKGWAYLVARPWVRSLLAHMVCHVLFLSYLAGSKNVSPTRPTWVGCKNGIVITRLPAKNVNFLFI